MDDDYVTEFNRILSDGQRLIKLVPHACTVMIYMYFIGVEGIQLEIRYDYNRIFYCGMHSSATVKMLNYRLIN